MIEITNKDYKPSINEIDAYINNPLFNKMYEYMNTKYKALYEIMYSGDKAYLGWNIKFYKSGKALCRLYPREGYFIVLVVVGRKEKEQAEDFLPQMCSEVKDIYNKTKEGMGQRWLMIELREDNEVYEDVLKLISFRRK